MPLISQLIEQHQRMLASGKVSSEPVAELPPVLDIPIGPMPGPGAVVTGLPVRGVYTPNQILDTDFLNNTVAMRSGPNLRSATFPPQQSSGAGSTLATQGAALALKAAAAATAASGALGQKTVVAVDPATGTLAQKPLNTLTMQRPQVSLDQLNDGGTYARVVTTALTANQIDPTKTGFLTRGSVFTSISGPFSYTATTSSITWTWTSLVIYRADGTTTAIANGSQAFTGLSSGTTYYFYPTYTEATGVITWVGGASTSTSVTSAQTQVLQGTIPMSLAVVTGATTSSGSGGGSGGGAGGGGGRNTF
jgi:hypothetical protein